MKIPTVWRENGRAAKDRMTHVGDHMIVQRVSKSYIVCQYRTGSHICRVTPNVRAIIPQSSCQIALDAIMHSDNFHHSVWKIIIF